MATTDDAAVVEIAPQLQTSPQCLICMDNPSSFIMRACAHAACDDCVTHYARLHWREMSIPCPACCDGAFSEEELECVMSPSLYQKRKRRLWLDADPSLRCCPG
jgi:hypothetical protein